MRKIKGLIFFILLILLVGVVSASEDVNDTISIENDNMELQNDVSDTLSVEDNRESTLSVEDNRESTLSVEDNEKLSDGINYNDIIISDKPLSHPQITVKSISGYQGKTLTLKATVKTEDGIAKKATVDFYFNGKTYTRTTNADGVASVTIKFPASKALKTTSKTKGNILTKTTTYKKTYYCDVTVNGEDYYTGEASFSVISKKKPVVKKYKIIKTKKTKTIKVKNGVKTYKWGNYGFVTYKHKSGYKTYIEVAGVGKKEGFIKFYSKEHYKKNGKWRWNSWYKVPKGSTSIFSYGSAIKCDKIKVRYTQVTYKRI